MQLRSWITGVAGFLTLLLATSCSFNDDPLACLSDSDCSPSSYCAQSGGVFFSTSQCVQRSTINSEPDDTGADATNDTLDTTDADTSLQSACTTHADCDDEISCTLDSCDDGVCQHVPDDTLCDDDNVCTDNHCDAALGCQIGNNNAPCDDGIFCNGADLCADGVCIFHQGTTCPDGVCNETLKECTECISDLDCGAEPEPIVTACTFDSICAATGTRTVTTGKPRCDNNTCIIVENTITEPCTRPSPTVECKPSEESWSTCMYAEVCSEFGSKHKSILTWACDAGTCKSTKSLTQQTAACNRNTNGTQCSTDTYIGTCRSGCCEIFCPPNELCPMCF